MRYDGIPSLRHCDTAGGLTRHNRATSAVPPRASMMLFAFMPARLSALNDYVKQDESTLNQSCIKLAYMDKLATWHDRLRYARILRGYQNHAEFARAVGVSPPAAHGWESGKTQILKGPNLVRVCQKLKISEVWLLDGKGEMDLPQAQVQQVQRCTDPNCRSELSEKAKRILGLLNDMTESQVDDLLAGLETTRDRNLRLFKELSERRCLTPTPTPTPTH